MDVTHTDIHMFRISSFSACPEAWSDSFSEKGFENSFQTPQHLGNTTKKTENTAKKNQLRGHCSVQSEL
jgi:hypothetical protein